jgi:hypothetical protein
MSQIGAGGISERESYNGAKSWNSEIRSLTFTQSTSQIEARGIRESLYFRNQRVKIMTSEVKGKKNEKCLYSSREYVYKVSLSSDDPKSTILLKKKNSELKKKWPRRSKVKK